MTRSARLAWYHFRKGPGFDYHGINVDIPDRMQFAFKRQVMRGNYEEPERILVDRFLDPRLPLLEIGGSLGILSAYISSKLDARTPYRIVEANPHIVDICTRNANGPRKGEPVEIVNAAVAYGATEVSFFASDNVHVSRVSNAAGSGTVTVPATSLDAESRAISGSGPYTLVMDIEGMEFDVFEKEAEALSRCALAIVEFHPHVFAERGKTVDAFFALGEEAGLRTIAVEGNSAAFAPAG